LFLVLFVNSSLLCAAESVAQTGEELSICIGPSLDVMAEVTVVEERIKINGGRGELYTKSFKPSGTAVGTVTFVHGLGEHCGRYDDIFNVFAQNGLLVNTYDQRGHGHSSGIRGYSPNMEANLSDIDLIAKQADPALPHFVYGHSFGGEQVLAWGLIQQKAKQFPVAGIVSSSPLIKLVKEKAPLIVTIGGLAAHAFPSVTVPNEVDANDISRDKEEVKKYVEDKLNTHVVSLSLASSFLAYGDRLLQEAKDFVLPLLIFHGSADRITSPKASEQFYNSARSSDKTFKLFEGYYHEPHKDPVPDRDVVIKTVIDWIVSRCGKWKADADPNLSGSALASASASAVPAPAPAAASDPAYPAAQQPAAAQQQQPPAQPPAQETQVQVAAPQPAASADASAQPTAVAS